MTVTIILNIIFVEWTFRFYEFIIIFLNGIIQSFLIPLGTSFLIVIFN